MPTGQKPIRVLTVDVQALLRKGIRSLLGIRHATDGGRTCATLPTMLGAAPAPQVSILSPDQDSEAAIVLGRAFVNDPPLKLILPHVTDLVERAHILSVVFALALTRQRLSGQPVFGIIRERRVAAVAITEGAQRHSTKAPLLKGLGMLFRMISAVGLAGTLRAVRFGQEIGKNRPREPHLYLSVIGVDPEQQGRHLGIALLDHLRSLLNLHSDWIGIYLETATECNLGYYARAGYQQLGEMHPLGVTMWSMMLARAQDDERQFPAVRFRGGSTTHTPAASRPKSRTTADSSG